MLNQIVIIGRLIGDPEKNKESNKMQITVAVPRPYKNENREYDTDFIDCILWEGIAEKVCENCKKGDLLGVRGRLESITENENRQTIVIAERITFLSSTQPERE